MRNSICILSQIPTGSTEPYDIPIDLFGFRKSGQPFKFLYHCLRVTRKNYSSLKVDWTKKPQVQEGMNLESHSQLETKVHRR